MAAALRYRLLLLDHDDTTVASTETIHYPAHIESIRQLRPDLQPCTLEQWFENNLDPGISVYLDSLFSAEQMKEEHSIWTRAMEKQRATFYDGMSELLAEFRQRGGQVAVISHSQAENIRKDYAARTPLLLPCVQIPCTRTDNLKRVAVRGDCRTDPMAARITPERVYGWELGEGKRKPSPWPALQAMRELQVPAEQTVMLDDLKPGVEMAIAAVRGIFAIKGSLYLLYHIHILQFNALPRLAHDCNRIKQLHSLRSGQGVTAVGAGWGHSIPSIQEYMRNACEAYFTSVAEFAAFLLGPEQRPGDGKDGVDPVARL